MIAEYNFNTIIKAIEYIKNNEDGIIGGEKAQIDIIKHELDTFFKGPKCVELLITNNTDKPMFGVYVKPMWNSEDILLNSCLRDPQDIITYTGNTDALHQVAFDKYQLEIDRKMIDMLYPAEICAIIINDINEIFNSKVTDDIRDIINAIAAYRGECICEQTVIDTISLFTLCVELTMHNITSATVFGPLVTQEGIDTMKVVCPEPTEFIIQLGLHEHFKSGVRALQLNENSMRALYTYNKAMILNWYFMNYTKTHTDLAPAMVIRRCIELEGSNLVKKSLVRVLDTISVTSPAEKAYLMSLTEAVAKRKKGLISQMKRNGLKSLEEDLYEYTMRLRNVETQDDAILLMRQLNSRMSILEDYLNYEDIDEMDRKRWEAVYRQYMEIRTELSKKTVYNRKMYGLFVDYNQLADMSQKDQHQVLQSYY